MRKEIIEQMKSYLNGNSFQSYDFSIDEKSLAGKNEPFVWVVYESGTMLQLLGKSFEDKLEEQQFRMRLFGNRLFPIIGMLYRMNEMKSKRFHVFYYDYLELREIKKEDVEKLYLGIWGEQIEQLKRKYKDEAEEVGKPIELVCKYDCEKFLEEQLQYARSLDDASLGSIMERLRNRGRDAVDQKIFLMKDGEHDFYFEERINGKMRLNGGIIFHANKSENRWESHT